MHMLIATVAIVWMVGSPPPATNRQQSQSQEQNSNVPSPTSPVTVIVNESPAPQQKETTPAQAHDWHEWFWPPVWSNWVLILVAAIAAYAAFGNLREIRRQSEATEKAANAASSNAMAVINAERAWVMVDVEWLPGLGRRSIGNDDTSIFVRLICTNDGKTPAWITEKCARFIIIGPDEALPLKPDLGSLEIVQADPEPLGVGKTSTKDITPPPQARGIQGIDDTAVFYGVVRYRDVFGKSRETVFGYRVTLGDEFQRLPEYPDYNKSSA